MSHSFDVYNWTTYLDNPDGTDGLYYSNDQSAVNNGTANDYSGYTQKYVATTGSDAADGSIGTPWKTIQYGMNQITTGGTVLNVRAGTYAESAETANVSLDGTIPWLIFNNSGSLASGYIVVRAYNGEAAILDQTDTAGGFLINGKNYIAVHDMEIVNCRSSGVHCKDEPTNAYLNSYVKVVDNEIHAVRGLTGDNVGGVRMNSCSYGLVQNNHIYDVYIDGANPQTNAACIHSYRMSNTVLEYNTLVDSANGVFWKQAVEGDGNCNIRYNYINPNWEGLRLGYQGSGYPGIEDSNVHHNLIINAHWGIQLYQGEDDVLFPCTNVKIYNNTIADGILDGGELAAGLKVDGAENLQFYNNLIADIGWPVFGTRNTGTETVTNEITDCDYNLYHTFSQFRLDWYGGAPDYSYATLALWRSDSKGDSTQMIVTASGPDLNGQDADPLFTNQAADDYTLGGGSPALTADRSGNSIGCYNNGFTIGADWSY